ncbi:unnamed protein product, partial [Linum tenue]
TNLQKYHPSRVLTLVYQPCALTTIVILASREAKINTRNRNLVGYALFFLSSLAVLVVSIPLFPHGGMIGDLSFMHPQFIQVPLRLITKAAFENTKNGLRKGALLFFAISSFFELICVVLYAFVFPKLPVVKYYRAKAATEGSKTVCADLAAGGLQTLPDQEVHTLLLFVYFSPFFSVSELELTRISRLGSRTSKVRDPIQQQGAIEAEC